MDGLNGAMPVSNFIYLSDAVWFREVTGKCIDSERTLC
jgi:hypothetical protein